MRIIRAVLLIVVLAGALHFTLMGVSAMRAAPGEMHHASDAGVMPECPMGYVCPFGTFEMTSTPAVAPALWASLLFVIVAWVAVSASAPRFAYGPPVDASPSGHVKRLLTVLKRE